MIDILTLIDLIAEADPGLIKPSRIRAITTSARQYAKLLGYDDPTQCYESAYVISRLERKELIESGLPEASRHKVRNLKNNISFLLTHAARLGFILIPSAETFKGSFTRLKSKTGNPNENEELSSANFGPSAYLSYDKWPNSLRRQYTDWRQWVLATPAKGVRPSPDVTSRKVEYLRVRFEYFFGFTKNVRKVKRLNFHLLIDSDLLRAFIHALAHEYQGQRAEDSLKFVRYAQSLAKYYFKDREAAKSLKDLYVSLIHAESALNKKNLTLKIKDLLKAAFSEFPKVHTIGFSGRLLAHQAARSIAMMLLATYPLKSGNYIEARLGINLYRNITAKWMLKFEDKGEPYVMEIPELLDPYLDDYVDFWRPQLTRDPSNNYLLLTREGNPYTSTIVFSQWIQRGTLRRLRVAVNPQLFRHVVATEIVKETKNFWTAAALMHVEPETVMKYYGHLLQDMGVENASKWVSSKINEALDEWSASQRKVPPPLDFED